MRQLPVHFFGNCPFLQQKHDRVRLAGQERGKDVDDAIVASEMGAAPGTKKADGEAWLPVWSPISDLENTWGTAVMTPLVTVIASLEQEWTLAFREALRGRMVPRGVLVDNRAADAAADAAPQKTKAPRSRRGKLVATEKARAVATTEIRQPMRVVGVNASAYDALLTHPQLDFSTGRVGNALLFGSTQRTVFRRPFGSKTLFSGFGGGLQGDSESAKESRSVLRQVRAAKMLQRTFPIQCIQYWTARYFGL